MIQDVSETWASPRFLWPEPLVIDLIHDAYRHAVAPHEAIMLAKLQERTLRALYDGATLRSSALRSKLTIFCSARGIDGKAIAKIDQAVLEELTRLVRVCFRTCPRVQVALAAEINAAFQGIAVSRDTPARLSSAVYQSTRLRRLH